MKGRVGFCADQWKIAVEAGLAGRRASVRYLSDAPVILRSTKTAKEVRGLVKRRLNKTLWAGCACGLLCALCVGAYLLSIDEEKRAAEAEMLSRYGGDQVQVCVAKHDIAAGETVAEGDVDERVWVASLLPADAVLRREDAVGKQVGSTILAGEVISTARFGFDTSAIDVPRGSYALSVPAKEVQAVGGALRPGVSADVYAVGSSSTTKLASEALILATSASQDAKGSGADAWVTLAVQPSRVQEMIQAAEGQTLYFALPGPAGGEGDSEEEER